MDNFGNKNKENVSINKEFVCTAIKNSLFL